MRGTSSSAGRPCLLVVGTGIDGASQTTLAARRAIESASRVLFAVADARTVAWLRTLRPDAESLSYGEAGVARRDIYRAMVERILSELRAGERVCVVFYGNPAFLTRAAHVAIERARSEGFVARMLPGVSAFDCLQADLAFDPGDTGCQMYEATDFLLRPRTIDVHTPLLLWQVAMVANPGRYVDADPALGMRGRTLLRDRLLASYPAAHRVRAYLASTEPTQAHEVRELALAELASESFAEAVTLFVPARAAPAVDPTIEHWLRELAPHRLKGTR